ncbi:hypothetical protein DQ354_16210 [Arthrobacter sp. AQ5-06]|nr:hypothetical protein DQ354_16210 [Arthrobacter sp. AQ5-06]
MSNDTKRDRLRSLLPPYHYGYGKDNVIYAYTTDEWGLGGGNTSGGNYQARMLSIMILITVAMVPAALIGLFTSIALAISLRWEALPALFFTLLFSGAVYSGFTASVHEIKARRLRKVKGLPKPWYAVTDDQARRWFEKTRSWALPSPKKTFQVAPGLSPSHRPGKPKRHLPFTVPKPLGLYPFSRSRKSLHGV